MIEGYEHELNAGKKAVEDARAQLESWFSRKLEDADIVGEERAVYDTVIRAVDSAFLVLNGKMKAVKTATETSFVGAREMLDAVNKEFQGCGLELGGAAGELISTSGRWSSNVQRDMLRRCKTAKVPVSKLQVPVIMKRVLMKR
ncbi:unnamed protein product, partial [Symbiodinium necroappetens]